MITIAADPAAARVVLTCVSMRIWSLVTALLLTAVSVTAQEPATSAADWSLRVTTEGGITGKGRGNIFLTSAGELTCTGETNRCGGKVSESDLRRLAGLVTGTDESMWVQQSRSTCSDCFVTTVTLRTRAGGALRTFVSRWDDSQAAAPALRNLLDAALAMARGQ